MEITKSVTFNFYGEIMQAFLTDEDKIILPMYELCGILGLSTSAQVQRIKRDHILSEGLFYIRTMAESSSGTLQTRRIACLWVKFLPFWLGSLNVNIIKPDLREKITAVKRDLIDFTWEIYKDHILPAEIMARLSTKIDGKEVENQQQMK
jgi:hypothetical protein